MIYTQLFCRLIVLLLLSLLVAGCASTNRSNALVNRQSSAPSTDKHYADIVATDLVSAVLQLSEFPAWATTVQFSEPSSAFGRSLVDTFTASGYGVQFVSADQGLNHVRYERRDIFSEQGVRVRYVLQIRDVEIHREFVVNDKQIIPTSAVTIIGTKPQNIALNDDIYRQLGLVGEFPSGVLFVGVDGEVVEFKKRNVSVTAASRRSKEDAISHQRFLIVARSRTLFTQKISNDIDVREWPAAAQITLVFPTDDTSILGEENKLGIKKLIASFDPDMHGFSLTGCASNKSLLWDGTETDSLDRQRRVYDELLAARVPLDLIRENGCYGSEFSDDLPKQGVILTLRAKKRSSKT